jgi:hypothetical protein
VFPRQVWHRPVAMAKKRKARAKKQSKKSPARAKRKARGGTELDEAFAVFTSAERIYPKLVAQRDQLAAELAKLDQALAKLRHVATRSSASAASKAPSAKPVGKRRGRPPGAGGSLSDRVLTVLSSASGPMTASEIAAAVKKAHPSAGVSGMQKTLRVLRDKGVLRASGKAKRFKYELK